MKNCRNCKYDFDGDCTNLSDSDCTSNDWHLWEPKDTAIKVEAQND